MISAKGGRRTAAAMLLVSTVGGCGFAGDATTDTAGIGAGALAGGLTANPFIGLAVGIATRFAAGAAVDAVERDVQGTIQSRIAEVAGNAGPNVAMPWNAEPSLPGNDEGGAVIVVRDFGEPLIPCREIVYSVFEKRETSFYVGTICKDRAGAWKWAVGEPATSRWGSLQ